MSIWDASQKYQADGVPLVVFGGKEYGTGSSRDWAAKGTLLLGVKAVIAESFSPGYWRGEIAMGFPQIACPGVLQAVRRWDEIEVDWTQHQLINHTQHTSLASRPLPSLAAREAPLL
mgnify:CR=1 FL=1